MKGFVLETSSQIYQVNNDSNSLENFCKLKREIYLWLLRHSFSYFQVTDRPYNLQQIEAGYFQPEKGKESQTPMPSEKELRHAPDLSLKLI